MAGTKLIPLTKGAVAIVDESDYDALLAMGSWHLNSSGYAVRRGMKNGIRFTTRMHRVVNKTPAGLFTDHLNHNRLDNRKANLRTVSQKENMGNYKGEKGYCWDSSKNKWMVRYKNTFYGRYETEKEAERAYRLAKSGVPYTKLRRKLWHLPTGITKQFDKYRVRPQVNGTRYWLGQFVTLEEAAETLNQWQRKRG